MLNSKELACLHVYYSIGLFNSVSDSVDELADSKAVLSVVVQQKQEHKIPDESFVTFRRSIASKIHDNGYRY